jgi:drug/metabolite transporter (DMT)-like permease
MGALLALGSGLAWGCADFIGGLAARRVGPLRVMVLSYPAGAILLTLLALTVVPGQLEAAVIGWSVFVGVTGSTAIFLLYAALALGPMGIVSPITALGSAAVPVVAGIIRGEALTLLVVAGMVLAAVAVILVSREPGPHRQVTSRALLLSAAAGLFLGMCLTGLGLAPATSGIWVSALGRWFASGLILLMAIVLFFRQGRQSWTPYPLALALAAGALDGVANGLFQVAAQRTELVIVAVISSLYPAATLLLARWLLGERLAPVQVVGVALALGAIVTLTV